MILSNLPWFFYLSHYFFRKTTLILATRKFWSYSFSRGDRRSALNSAGKFGKTIANLATLTKSDKYNASISRFVARNEHFHIKACEVNHKSYLIFIDYYSTITKLLLNWIEITPCETFQQKKSSISFKQLHRSN